MILKICNFSRNRPLHQKQNNMKLLLSLIFSAFISQSFAQVVINDKNAEIRNVGSFSGIKVSGGIDVYLSQGQDYAIAVSASEDKFRDAIHTEVRNGILMISYNNENILKFDNNKNLRAYISFKDLSSIEASGACDINFKDKFFTNSFRLKLSGACEIKGAIAVKDLDLEISGATTVRLTGTVENIKLKASGASDLKKYELVTENCIASISGASDIRMTVNKSLSVKASGASSFYYYGNPEKKDISESGASSISKRN